MTNDGGTMEQEINLKAWDDFGNSFNELDKDIQKMDQEFNAEIEKLFQ